MQEQTDFRSGITKNYVANLRPPPYQSSKRANMINMLTKREWSLLISIVVYSFIPVFGGLIRVLELAGGLALIPENPRALTDPLPVILHVLSSFTFCIAGAIQFLPSVRQHHPLAHRAMGRVLVIAGCISAASGLWMTYFYEFPEALQGSLLFSTRVILGFLMIGLIGWAVLAIRAGNVFQHGASMLRAYAIGQGASTQALFGIGWIIISGTEPTGFLRDAFMLVCWLLNMIAAEILIHRFIIYTRSSAPTPIEAGKQMSDLPPHEI